MVAQTLLVHMVWMDLVLEVLIGVGFDKKKRDFGIVFLEKYHFFEHQLDIVWIVIAHSKAVVGIVPIEAKSLFNRVTNRKLLQSCNARIHLSQQKLCFRVTHGIDAVKIRCCRYVTELLEGLNTILDCLGMVTTSSNN